jgi:hypothetical protein
MIYFGQNEDLVVIQTSRNKCTFRKDMGLYKFLYLEQHGKRYVMADDFEEANCPKITLICFREKTDDVIHFTHIDKDFDVITEVFVKVKLI